MKEKLIRYGVLTGTGLLVSVGVMSLRGVFAGGLSTQDLMKALCDAFFVPGILWVLFGCLAWISFTGFFDGLAYIGSYALHTLLPLFGRSQRQQKYYDYKTEKMERRKRPDHALLLVGAGFVLVSFVFWRLYYAV